jgi:hypothetical protein
MVVVDVAARAVLPAVIRRVAAHTVAYPQHLTIDGMTLP